MQYIKIEVALIDIRKVLDRPSSKNYKEIRGSIESLYKTEIVLKDFTHPLDGIKYKEYNTRILHEYGFLKDNKNIYVLKFDEMFLVNILRHTDRQTNKKIGNFTPIDVVSVRELRSKYAKRLYEYLVSIKNHKKEFSLNIDSLNKLFGVNHKIIARHTEIVKRIHLQVSSKVPFSYEVHRYDKLISFRIIARGMELIGA